jgi:F420 biosynthesis protein FbiB-like protein
MSASSSPSASELPASPAAGAAPGPLGFFASRRSVRDLLPGPVEPGILAQLLEIVRTAPSAHGAQPWRVVVIETPELRDRLAQGLAAGLDRYLAAVGEPAGRVQRQVAALRRRVQSAPLALLVCVAEEDLPPPDPRRDGAGEHALARQSAALAAGWLLLGAHSLGLGACWFSAPIYAPQVCREALRLPPSWDPQALVLIGRGAPGGPRRPPRDPAEIISYR